MASKKKKTYIHDITNEDMFTDLTSREDGPLVVVDAFLDWCGPCQPMDPNYATLYYMFEDPDNRIKFYRANENVIPEEAREKLELNATPRFILYRGGKIVHQIKGARYNELVDAINKHIPEHNDE